MITIDKSRGAVYVTNDPVCNIDDMLFLRHERRMLVNNEDGFCTDWPSSKKKYTYLRSYKNHKKLPSNEFVPFAKILLSGALL